MIIRRAKLLDTKQILKLEKQWEIEKISYGIYISKNREKELLNEIKKQIWYVAEQNNKIIGFIHGEIIKSKKIIPAFDIKKGEKYGELYEIYINKKFRGKNIGNILMNKLLNYFKENKIKKIKLKAVSKNILKLVEYYNKFGFKERIVDMMLVL